jgi:hypothetical protein
LDTLFIQAIVAFPRRVVNLPAHAIVPAFPSGSFD